MLLNSIVNASIYTKCISLSNQKYITQPVLINLHPNDNSPILINFTTIHLRLN